MNHGKWNSLTIFLALLFTALICPAFIPAISAASNIQDIHHEPAGVITSDDKVTINITLNSTDNLSSIQYQYCDIDPPGTCSIYTNMTHVGGKQYSAVIMEKDGGSTIGYKVKIEYDNGSEEYSPGKDSYHEYLVEEDKKDDDSPFASTPLLVMSLLLAVMIIRTQKNHRR